MIHNNSDIITRGSLNSKLVSDWENKLNQKNYTKKAYCCSTKKFHRNSKK